MAFRAPPTRLSRRVLLRRASRAAPVLALGPVMGWPVMGCGDSTDTPQDAGARDAASDAASDAADPDANASDAALSDTGVADASSDAAVDSGGGDPLCAPMLTRPSDFVALFGGGGTVAEWRKPALDAASWQLSVTGLVEQPLTLTLADLEADVASHVRVLKTIECVFGAWGTAIWTGVPVRALLDRAGIDRDRTRRVRFHGADDFHDSLLLEHVYAEPRAGDPFEPIVAFRIAGEPLPMDLGFPARLITGDRLGFKNIKWLVSIEATDDIAPFSLYFEAGVSDEAGVVPLQARIEGGPIGVIDPGLIAVCGHALSGHGGIEGVELSFDGGPYTRAALPSLAQLRALHPELDATAQVRDAERHPFPFRGVWMPWELTWDATPGEHTIEVRALETSGEQSSAMLLRVTVRG